MINLIGRVSVEKKLVTGSVKIVPSGNELQSKKVTPSTADQVVRPDPGYDGLSDVTVAGEKNLQAGNIKYGVSVFNVMGTFQGDGNANNHALTVTPTGKDFTEYPYSGFDGIGSVTVKGDENLKPDNIVEGVEIYGVVGTHKIEVAPEGEASLSSVYVTPTGQTFEVTGDDEGVDGFHTVIVEGDPNLRPEYIAKGITIYGVTGTMTMGVLEDFPEEFRSYKDTADALYVEKFGAEPPVDFFMLASDGGSVTFGYMSDAFSVSHFNTVDTEFKATGWKRISYRSVTDEWVTDDFANSKSAGGNYLKHIRYCTREKLYYENNEVWPKIPVTYMYGNKQFPSLPDFDKTNYPYAVIVKETPVYGLGRDGYYFFALGTDSYYFETDTGVYFGGYSKGELVPSIEYKYSDGAWTLISVRDNMNISLTNDYSKKVWTNVDLKYNGTMFISKSDPIPQYK